MRQIAFHQEALEQYSEWAMSDKKLFDRIHRLIIESARNPFSGIGKPELLKSGLHGYWSRRITDEHRLVYFVDEETITIAACKFHY